MILFIWVYSKSMRKIVYRLNRRIQFIIVHKSRQIWYCRQIQFPGYVICDLRKNSYSLLFSNNNLLNYFVCFIRKKHTKITFRTRKKKKQSHYRLGQALRVPRGWGFQIWRQHMKVVSLSAPAAFTLQGKFLLLFSVSCRVDPPVPDCGRKDYVNEKFQCHHGESNSRPSGL